MRHPSVLGYGQAWGQVSGAAFVGAGAAGASAVSSREVRDGSGTRRVARKVRAMHAVTYQKKVVSWPLFFRASAIGSVRPPKVAVTRACGRPTPSARTLVGNISALMMAASAEYPLRKVSATVIRRNAIHGLLVSPRTVMIGTVRSMPLT